MCEHCGASSHRLLAKDSPLEDEARQTFIEELVAVLREWHGDVLSALESDDVPLATVVGARRAIRRIFEEHQPAFRTTFETGYVDLGEAGRATAARRHDLDIDPDLSERVARELRKLARDTADATGGRMTEDIAEALQDAWDEGLGTPEIERILREEVFPEMRGYEAERSARTAATTASNRGQLSSFRDAGAPGKTWLTEDDGRQRESHDEIDGQTVPLGAKFTTGAGNSARFPGDPHLPPSDRIQCRCGMAPAWNFDQPDHD